MTRVEMQDIEEDCDDHGRSRRHGARGGSSALLQSRMNDKTTS